MKKVVFSLLALLFALLAEGQESQTQYNFLRLPVSAHAAALGGDNITIIEDDPTLTFNNPALQDHEPQFHDLHARSRHWQCLFLAHHQRESFVGGHGAIR